MWNAQHSTICNSNFTYVCNWTKTCSPIFNSYNKNSSLSLFFPLEFFLIFYFMYYYKMYVMDKYIFLFAFALSPTTHTLHQVNIVFIYVYTHIPLPAHTHWVQMHARQFFVFQYVEREYVKRNVNALFRCWTMIFL